MHTLTIKERVDLGPKNIVSPGEYIIDDVNAAHILILVGAGTMTPLPQQEAPPNPTSVIFMRAGGFGDLTLLTPVLREHKRRFPNVRIGVSTMAHYAPVLANLPYVDEILPYPLPKETAEKWDRWVFFENAIERNPRAKELHMTNLFGEIAGINDIEDLLPEYRVKSAEAVWCHEAFPRTELRRICIQIGASAAARVYPRDQMGLVINQMAKSGWEVFLLGEKGEVKTPDQLPPLIRNLAEMGLTMRQSAAVVATCDCFIGNDSALLHIAGALGVPAVGLYGPFPWKLRTAHSPSIFALQGAGECSPCYHHVNAAKRNHFPDACPSKAKGHCAVLADIKPDRIVAKVAQVMRHIEPVKELVAL